MLVLWRLWSEDEGFVFSSELVLASTLLVIGMVTGVTAIRDSVDQEMGDVAAAIGNINQSYAWDAVLGHHAQSAGSSYNDIPDDCDSGSTNPSECVVIATGLNTGEQE